MFIPNHVNPSADRTASASYNFVPLPEIVVPVVKDPNKALSGQDSFHLTRKAGY